MRNCASAVNDRPTVQVDVDRTDDWQYVVSENARMLVEAC